mgnify:CR=1 FL=1
MTRVVLGSGSPRRLELLRAFGVEPIVVVPDIDESVLPGEHAADYVRRLASTKLDAVMREVGSVSVGMEPVALALRNDGELWVANHLSDSISIVDVSSTPPRVVRTLLTCDEPSDIVFAAGEGDFSRRADIASKVARLWPLLTIKGL